MKNCKKLIGILTVLSITLTAVGQTSTNSPYTRYGFGQLENQGFGFSKGMGGIGYGMRNGSQINILNPASYSAVDSLTMLFDLGISLQNTNFKEGSTQTNAKNSSLDYIAMQFRLRKDLGFTIGFVPFSTVGYNLSSTKEIDKDVDGNSINAISTYNGTGGLHQVFVGVGYKFMKNLSVGANLSYLYGDIDHTISTTFNSTSAYTSAILNNISVNDYKLDLGLQYSYNLSKEERVNLGLTYSYGHNLNSTLDVHKQVYASSSSAISDSLVTTKNAFSLPSTFGAGFTYVKDNKLTIGADYTFQKWSSAKYNGTSGSYYSDQSRISLGAEYIPNMYSRNYLNRIKYRIGAYMSNSYTKVNGNDAAKEYSVSAGFGLPIFRSKSMLNISGQYIKVSPKVKGMLEENSLRVNVGITFNEDWFRKYKVD